MEFSGHSGHSWKNSTLPMIFSPTPNNRCRKKKHASGQLSYTGPHHQQRKDQGVQDQRIQHYIHHSPIQSAGESGPVDRFTYFGSILDNNGGTDADVRTRIGKAREAFHQLKNI
ncbi:hypothetical protein DPMN_010498 [Dreissena polymorpha]|uniref:Uncharacterized protein n=1 Tax=Dreissena polymorpha TaxID=45954 RepID=A0A9D4MYW0_DREPO|nr:hypothetical protein DPMN_010498 [Dreissena polymorpha]